MSEEETVSSEQLAVISDQSTVISKQGQAAEGELGALKAAHAAEILALTEQVEALRDAVKERLSSGSGASEDGQSGGQELDGGDEGSGSGVGGGAFVKTAGVKDRSGGGRSLLRAAASQAGQTGSRVDVQEYLRVRRNYV